MKIEINFSEESTLVERLKMLKEIKKLIKQDVSCTGFLMTYRYYDNGKSENKSIGGYVITLPLKANKTK